MSNKVLVVGSKGFIGSRLMWLHPEWDGVDLEDGQDFITGSYQGYDAIVMLAAHHVNFKHGDYTYNLELYRALSSTVKSIFPKPFVLFVSSAAVYENAGGTHHEFDTLEPATLYGKSKVIGEQIVKDICENYTIVRLSNVYGDGDGRGAVDLFKRGWNKIYGDGEQVRDYIYVDDVVSALNRIMESSEQHFGETYNISSNVGQTTNEVFGLYGRTKAVHLEARPTDIAHSILDNCKAKEKGLL